MPKTIPGRPPLPRGAAVDMTYPARLSENTLIALRENKETTGLPINTQIRHAIELYLSKPIEPEPPDPDAITIHLSPDLRQALEDKGELMFAGGMPAESLLHNLAMAAIKRSGREVRDFISGEALAAEIEKARQDVKADALQAGKKVKAA